MKYLSAYIVPISGLIAVTASGFWTYSGALLVFFIIPLIELFVSRTESNYDEEETEVRIKNKFFDLILYVNLPLVYAIVILFLMKVTNGNLSTFETIGMVLSVGTVLSACGINVAHELGHKKGKLPQTVAKMLLLPELYMHFFIEHNRGHHLRVATREDPATARYNETLYAFWFRSVIGSYINAWKLENKRLSALGKPVFGPENEMLLFQIIQLVYLSVIYVIFGVKTMVLAIVVGVIAFLLLECVNYIEHYGLERKRLPNGKYEKVNVTHSWNSNHDLGRIMLYELTRHSDHHYKASRKYQVLRHFDESPQLPYGYPGSIILSFFPFLWFSIMNKKIVEMKSNTPSNHFQTMPSEV